MEQQTNSRRQWLGRVLRAMGRQFIPNVGTLLLVALLLWAQQAGAFPFNQGRPQSVVPNALPETITYQGKLTDAAGIPVTGNIDMAFALYDVSSGGTALWSESYSGGSAVPVQEGEFTVHLGTVNPISSTIWEASPLYVGIQVGSDIEMSPREVVSAVPAAAHAGVASLALAVPDGAIKSRNLDLDYGSVCLSGNAYLNLPGGESVLVPGMTLNLNLERPSMVLFWMDGLARFDQASNADCAIGLVVDDDPLGLGRTNTYGYFDYVWFNIDGVRIAPLDSGPHTVELHAQSTQAGTMLVHGPGSGYNTCINYLVLGEQ